MSCRSGQTPAAVSTFATSTYAASLPTYPPGYVAPPSY
jgi:hypothetical protein